MSAFAAFSRLSRNSSELLLFNPAFSTPISKSNVRLSLKNAIFADESIIVGLNKDDFIIANGTYELKVLRGHALVNNVLKIGPNSSHKVVTNANQALPVICGSESSSPNGTLLPSFSTVIELVNYDAGLQHIDYIQAQLRGLYLHQPNSQYTFEVKEEAEEGIEGLKVDQSAYRAINEVGAKLSKGRTAIITGAPLSGKLTFAHRLLDYMAMNGSVALLDLEPNSGKFSPPGCLALTVHKRPSLGVHDQNRGLSMMTRYYGHSNMTSLPSYYSKCVRELKRLYDLELLHLPLIVNAPTGIKGLARKELSTTISLFTTPTIVYLSQNGSPGVEEFEDDFEVQDNPDEEVIGELSELTNDTVYKVQATRRKPKYFSYSHEIALLQYFHRKDSVYDFSFLVELAPQLVSFSKNDPFSVPYVVSLHQNISKLHASSLEEYLEASVVGLCSVDLPERLTHKTYPQIITTDEFSDLKHHTICLCIIHLITKSGHCLVYLPRDSSVISSLRQETSKKNSLAFVRGDFSIPSGEILTPHFLGKSIPYVASEPLSKVGGVWNARKTIGRKNQR